jgi:hypothetical protein
MVTTKKGRNGKLTVEMNSTYATQNTANRIDLLNADDFATYQNRIITNGGGGTPYIQGLANTDWQDLIYRSGSTANHQLLSGGSDKMNFMLLQYFKQDGIIINSDFEKATFLTNIDAKSLIN